jgi:hypothetical protein
MCSDEGKGATAACYDTGIPLERRGRDPQLSTQIEDAAHERSPIVAKSQAEPLERHDRIDSQLSRSVNQATAAPIEPADLQAPRGQLFLFQEDVGPAARAAHRDQGRVLAQKQAAEAIAAPADFVNAAFEQKLGRLKVDRPQQPHVQLRRIAPIRL